MVLMRLAENSQHTTAWGATSNTIALGVASQPAVIQQQQVAKQALQGKHNNSKQQNKRYKANSTATATRHP